MLDRRRWLHGVMGRALPIVAGVLIFSLVINLPENLCQIATEADASVQFVGA
jgi:hypothetical protein